MFTNVFGKRVIGKTRDILAGEGGYVCYVCLLVADFEEEDMATPADAKKLEASFAGYARKAAGDSAWSQPYTHAGRPSIATNMLVWTYDWEAANATPFVSPAYKPTLLLFDGIKEEKEPTVYGYFLLLKNGAAEELVQTRKFSTPVTLSEDNPQFQFAPVVSFERVIP